MKISEEDLGHKNAWNERKPENWGVIICVFIITVVAMCALGCFVVGLKLVNDSRFAHREHMKKYYNEAE